MLKEIKEENQKLKQELRQKSRDSTQIEGKNLTKLRIVK